MSSIFVEAKVDIRRSKQPTTGSRDDTEIEGTSLAAKRPLPDLWLMALAVTYCGTW